MQKTRTENLDILFGELRERYNLDLAGYAPASLERRLERFLSLYRFDDPDAWREKLLSDKSFFDLFIKEITVNTTEMFRDPESWKVIREKILPLVADHPSIRIWHSGCSSGEEVFSMAILLKEEGLLEKTKIIASDINRDVMKAAAEGIYSMKSLALNEENYLRAGGKASLLSYMDTGKTEYLMHKDLLQHVRFTKHDLSTGNAFSKFDIILCRNVMIYFNKQLQEKVFGIFHQSLFKRGFVVIGKKESMAYYTGAGSFSEFSAEGKNIPAEMRRMMGKHPAGISAIVIGGSAGSIPVLNDIIAGLPRNFALPLIICVHRMKNVSEGIREVFAAKSMLPIVEPNDKAPVEGGKIYLAPSNYHLLIEKDLTFSLSTEAPVNYSRPAIDMTLSSAANAYRKNLAGILLTGANKDGATGMECIRKNGGITIVQDPEECAAPFMPLAALEKKCIDSILSTVQIISFLRSFVHEPA